MTANPTIIPAPRLSLAILAAIVLPVFANGVLPGLGVPLAILFSAAVALGGIGVMELIIASLLFQNVFIAITAGLGGGLDHLNLARATNFIVCGTVWCVVTWMYATNWRTIDARLVTGGCCTGQERRSRGHKQPAFAAQGLSGSGDYCLRKRSTKESAGSMMEHLLIKRRAPFLIHPFAGHAGCSGRLGSAKLLGA